MPCDTKLKPGQTIQQRAEEVRAATQRLAADLAAGRVKPTVSPNGAIVFDGWAAQSRDNVTDNCAYRRLMAGTSTLAKLAIQRAEQLAGRGVDRRVVNSGVHSHDGGKTWHKH